MPRSYLIVQISDVHLTPGGELRPGVRTRDNLVRGLRELAAAGLRPDVFLLTGDLTDTGDGACYDDLAAILTEAAAGSGASVIYLPGNHDEREAFRRHLLGGAGVPGTPLNQTHWRDGLRVVALDSTIPGEDGGRLDEATLGYLRAELAATAPDGTIVALHHPPVPSPVEPLSAIALRDPQRLRDAIAGSDVRIVLSGHYHHEVLGMLGATPAWVSPAVAYQNDTARAFHHILATAFSRIDLGAAGDGPLVTVFPVTAA